MNIYLNGTKTDAANASVSVFDLGFTMGVTVTEQIRTYQRELPLLDRHLDRWFGGLKIIGLKLPFSREQIETQVRDLITDNGRGLADHDELGIGVCATPGITSVHGQMNRGPTVLIYTYPLPKAETEANFREGVRLSSVATVEVPGESIPKALKCRSRMHYYLAEQEARAIDPDSRALLNNPDGFVAEGTTASVVMIQSGRLVTPTKESVLPSVTLAVVLELANKIGISVDRRAISVSEMEQADEVLWLSTPAGILPATHVNQNKIGDGGAGELTQKLVDAWNAELYRQ